MNITRTQFLRGDFGGKQFQVRPPWSVPEDGFVILCSRCDACLDACPQRIVVRGRGGFPRIDFSRGACTFCGECVASCRDGALRREDGAPAWSWRAGIGPECLAIRSVVCRSCADACEAGAIRFSPRPGGIAIPDIDQHACNGCGACIAGCPAQAITLAAASAAIVAIE